MSDTMASTASELRQPSLFTRLAAVEAELRTLNVVLAGLKEDHQALRKDRDEWRWRAERLLAEREEGILSRLVLKAWEILGAVAARLRLLMQKHPLTFAQGRRSGALRLGSILGLRRATIVGVPPRLELNQSQEDGAVALAGPAHSSHPIHDGGLDLDEALASVALHRPSARPTGQR